jgi:hypothetical protein
MPVTAVSIKGDSGRISGHHAALRRAIARSATLAAAVSTPGDSHSTRSERQ